MPPTRGASWMWKIDGGFPCYVVLIRNRPGISPCAEMLTIY